MPNSLEEIRYYGNIVAELEKSTDKESEGALKYYKSKFDEAIQNYVRGNVA